MFQSMFDEFDKTSANKTIGIRYDVFFFNHRRENASA